jgi:tRNA 2-thiocytidine biosynthesis protein TtcA
MPIRLAYRKYPVSLIRPLAYLDERQVIAFAQEAGIMKAACTCPYGRNSARRDIRGKIAAMTGGSLDAKRRILQALASGPTDLLVDDRPIELEVAPAPSQDCPDAGLGPILVS